MSSARGRKVRVEVLARVEGEGAIDIAVRRGRVDEVLLRIVEPPRLFEAFLRGRAYGEAPDITARICGICPIAYQMSAAAAMERALGVAVDGPLRELRRLLYCGEWISSHALHVHLLHAPDFLGFEGAFDMARGQAEAVARGLRIKKAGNDLVTAVGGREIHPVSVKVGGFWRVPPRKELTPLVAALERAREDAVASARWAATLPLPEFERDWTFVALRHPVEYAMLDGRVASSDGLDIGVESWESVFLEDQVAHSAALHATLRGQPYLTGPLARFALNADKLSAGARDLAKEIHLVSPCRNPFAAILVRAVETVHAIDEALAIIAAWQPPEEPCLPVAPRESVGCGASEAPRGVLFHRYRLEADGTIASARIVPPTAQNLRTIEDDLRSWAEGHLDLDDTRLSRSCETVVRNHDPCISCATHALRVRIVRES